MNNLERTLKNLEEQMSLRFKAIRDEFRHSGNKGSNAEQILREFLRSYLPVSFRIGQGEVMDSYDAISRQIDVVITNEHHPFVNDLQGPSNFFIEGVACAAEVKSSLTGAELEKGLEVARSFKNLRPALGRGVQVVGGHREDLERFAQRRPFFIFAFESKLAPETIRDKVNSWNAENAKKVDQQVDGIFTLDGLSLINYGGGGASFRCLDARGEAMKGFHFVQNRPLLELLFWLSLCIRKVHHPYPPIVYYLAKDRMKD